MFDFVGKHKRLLQILLALILIPPFAFFGIQSFTRMVGGTDLAEVDGSGISPQEFSRALEQQRDQLRAALGKNFDPALLDTPEARKQLLDGLVGRRVLGLYIVRNRMGASDDQVRELIAAEPAFQEDGKFSRGRYEALIRAQNMSEAQFESQLRSDLVMRQLTAGLVDSGFVAKTAAQRIAALRGETREVSESILQASQFAGQVKLAPDVVEAYYKAHPKEFEVPEQIRAEYAELTLDAVVAGEPVPVDEVKAWYETNIAPKRRERLEARKRIEALAAEVRKDPARFAEIAKEKSQDPGSAAQGGDLGWFARGAMVKPFEDAVFKLRENELSPIVETDFGFHVIKLTGIRKGEGGKGEERRASHILVAAPGDAKDFESSRAEIERDLRRERAQKRFPELAEQFSNMAYEQPDGLAPLAERFKVQIRPTVWFGRGNAPPPLNNPKLVTALFGDDALRNKRNTEAVEVAPGRVVVARVLEHKPAAVRPLDEVRDAIAKRLIQEEALKLAQAAGMERLKQLQSGQDPGSGWTLARTVSRENPAGLDPRAVPPVFRVDTAKLPAYVGVDLPPGAYGVYRVSKVTDAQAADDAKLRALDAMLSRQESREGYQAFIDSLRGRAKVTVNEDNLKKSER
ncbi:MAG TPA: SurA N-terminal domain-containing protein [Burkholderiales bacterium]|nr:SurA N-terminal domain-containing protein [Burkholderiales bacterium]